jgi:hypothetical protein
MARVAQHDVEARVRRWRRQQGTQRVEEIRRAHVLVHVAGTILLQAIARQFDLSVEVHDTIADEHDEPAAHDVDDNVRAFFASLNADMTSGGVSAASGNANEATTTTTTTATTDANSEQASAPFVIPANVKPARGRGASKVIRNMCCCVCACNADCSLDQMHLCWKVLVHAMRQRNQC